VITTWQLPGRCKGAPELWGVQLAFSDEVVADTDVGPEVNQVVACKFSVKPCEKMRSGFCDKKCRVSDRVLRVTI